MPHPGLHTCALQDVSHMLRSRSPRCFQRPFIFCGGVKQVWCLRDALQNLRRFPDASQIPPRCLPHDSHWPFLPTPPENKNDCLGSRAGVIIVVVFGLGPGPQGMRCNVTCCTFQLPDLLSPSGLRGKVKKHNCKKTRI